MASQAQVQQEKIDKYANNPFHNPAVLAEMKRLNQYANTIDLDLAKKAHKFLQSPTNSLENTFRAITKGIV